MVKKVVMELDEKAWEQLRKLARANKRATSREAQHIIEDRMRQLKAEQEAANVEPMAN